MTRPLDPEERAWLARDRHTRARMHSAEDSISGCLVLLFLTFPIWLPVLALLIAVLFF